MLTLKKRKASLRSVSFSPDGSKVAAAGQRGNIQVWDLATRTLVCDITKKISFCDVVLFPSEGLIYTIEVGSVYAVHLSERNRKEEMVPFRKLSTRLAALSPDRAAVCVLTFPHVGRYPLPDCQEAVWRQPVVPHALPAGPQSVAWGPCERFVAVGQNNGLVRVFDAVTGEHVTTLGEEGKTEVNAVALSPDGATAAWCARPTLHVKRFGAGGFHVKHSFGKAYFHSVAFHPSGEFVATVNGDGKADYWDARTGERRQSFDWGVGKLRAIAFSPDGDRAACCSEEGHVVVWDVDR
jgi:WD40 repeat protein